MLPNLRKTETDTTRVQPGQAANDQTGAFPARPILAADRRGEKQAISIIGPDLIITGNLVSKGEVLVEGTIDGDVHGSHVVVGQSAQVTGGVVAEEIVVRGHVTGTVRGKRVMLQATSQVDGDIYHNALAIEQGAMFEGKSRRTKDDPREGVTLAAVAQPRAHAVGAAVSGSEPQHDFSGDESEAVVTIVPPKLPNAKS